MCLAIPGKVIATGIEDDILMGKVDFGGVIKRVCLDHTAGVQIGQYVLVHVGFALQVLDENEARQVFEFLKQINGLEELREDGTETEYSDLDHEIPGRISGS
jgi:hydrogenase expression/formation protein HypC